MNILLTNRCNRRCPYCFAQERVSYPREGGAARPAPPFISRTDYRTAIAFAAKKPSRRGLGILGGEPSMHPDFVELLTEAWELGLTTCVFTNGLWRETQIEAVEAAPPEHRRRVKIVLNVNEPDRTPDAERRGQDRLLRRLGRRCTLSFNVYHVDFDGAFLVDLVQRHRTRRSIRLGVSMPVAGFPTEHVPLEDYPKLASGLLALARRCDEHDVQLAFDCGFLLCMLPAEAIGELVLTGARFAASCGPAVDVGTDLSTWACFPLSAFSGPEDHLSHFDDEPALDRHFRDKFERLYRSGALPECVTCRHRRRRQCSGGCAAHVHRRLSTCA